MSYVLQNVTELRVTPLKRYVFILQDNTRIEIPKSQILSRTSGAIQGTEDIEITEFYAQYKGWV